MSDSSPELRVPPSAGTAPQTHAGLQGRARAVAGLAVVAVPLAVWFGPWGLEPHAQHGLALMAFVLLGWMTHVLDAVTG